MKGVSRRLRSFAAIGVAALALAGCASASADTPPAQKPAAPTVADLPTTTSVLTGHDFTMVDQVRSGTHSFVFTTSDPSGHTVLLIQMHKGVPLSQFIADMWGSHSATTPAQTLPWAQKAEGEADNLGGAMVSSDGPARFTTVLQPGTYDLIDFDGAGLAEEHPVVREFKAVGPAPTDQLLPAPSAVVTSITSGGTGQYVISGTLKAHGTYLYTNQARCPQETAIFQVKPGTTLQDIQNYFTATFGGGGHPIPPPFIGGPHGIPGMEPGQTAAFTLSVPPGQYLIVSFVVDLRNGLRAASEGMLQLVTLN